MGPLVIQGVRRLESLLQLELGTTRFKWQVGNQHLHCLVVRWDASVCSTLLAVVFKLLPY